MSGPDIEMVAEVIVTASRTTKSATAQMFGISKRTVERYLANYKHDPQVAELVAKKRQLLSIEWANEAERVQNKLLRRIEALSETCERLHEVTGAYKIVGELRLAERINDRLSEQGSRAALSAETLGQVFGGGRPTESAN